MTGCAKCGDCCEEIWIPQNRETVEGWQPEPFPEGYSPDKSKRDPEHEAVWQQWDRVYDRFFIRDNWHAIMVGEAQLSRQRSAGSEKYAYTCDQWNHETRLCEAHDNRPPICRGFPWYGFGPGDMGLPRGLSRCSFWRDIAPERWPEGTSPLPDPDAANG